ncbi:hypothetical protein VZT92_008735 [Zoarces viviparus]|uniref:Uncharacterized protein n=1 Tax=Zoarces viviparus TaxID=48416 RepID=A0AAW1FG63_ZOAVI
MYSDEHVDEWKLFHAHAYYFCVAPQQIKTSTKPPSLLSSPLSWLLRGPVSGWRNVLWAGVVAVAWDQLGGSAIPPSPCHSALPRAGRLCCGNAETRRGGILLEDLPEKCHAGSDEE